MVRGGPAGHCAPTRATINQPQRISPSHGEAKRAVAPRKVTSNHNELSQSRANHIGAQRTAARHSEANLIETSHSQPHWTTASNIELERAIANHTDPWRPLSERPDSKAPCPWLQRPSAAYSEPHPATQSHSEVAKDHTLALRYSTMHNEAQCGVVKPEEAQRAQ